MLAVANWKMHGTRALLASFASAMPARLSGVERVICPPFPYIADAVTAFFATDITIGAQHAHSAPEGAHTGDVSFSMLTDVGAKWVILGHSERRTAYGESDVHVASSAAQALMAGITPIICVGESSQQRQAGQELAVVGASLAAIKHGLQSNALKPERLVIAYEPVWAIGTGKIPTMDEVSAMHHYIHQQLAGLAGRVEVLYGGSVKPDNAAMLAAVPGVSGFLIGGASLQPASFQAIAEAQMLVAP